MLITLEWLLKQLIHTTDKITSFTPDVKDLFSYLNGQGLEKTAAIALSMSLIVISNYIRLIEKNFPKLCEKFPSYRAKNSQLILELSEDISPFKSDYLHLSYVWLPSFSGEPQIRIVPFKESLAELFIVNRKSVGNISANGVHIKTTIGGMIDLIESDGFISRVTYPDSQPISSQVYQLLQNEAEYVFGNHYQWDRVTYATTSSYYQDLALLILGEHSTSRKINIGK